MCRLQRTLVTIFICRVFCVVAARSNKDLEHLRSELIRQSIQLPNPGAFEETHRRGSLLYVPVQNSGAAVSCPTENDAVAISITQLLFLTLVMSISSLVLNISNNVNNNNNNNNRNSLNVNSNNNLVSNTNVNNGNQVNVMVPVLNP